MDDEDWHKFTKEIKRLEKKQVVSKTYAKPKIKVIEPRLPCFSEFGILFDKTAYYSKKKVKSLRKQEINQKIDLHGMTLEEAFIKLKSFLLMAQEENQKCVIAICGLGKTENFEFTGKIKNNIEHWLEGFKKSGIVGNYVTAEKNRGGEGAYRIYLKNKFKN